MEVLTFFGTVSESPVDAYVLKRLLWLFPVVVDLSRRPGMPLSKGINGGGNSAVVKSHSSGKTKLDNLFGKKEELVPFQRSKNAENKKNHPIEEYKDKSGMVKINTDRLSYQFF